MEDPFTLSELNSTLGSLKISSSPGLDQIDYRIIRSLPSQYHETLLTLYNSLVQHKSFPEDWSRTLVVLIPKPNGKGVRPISLLSCWLKILEKLVYRRLQWYVESSLLLPNFQFGFRPARSCVDNLVLFTNSIRTALQRGHYSVIVFLDIEGAFDNVVPSILISDLEKLGIPARIRKFIEFLTLQRYLVFVSQDSLLGPYTSLKGTLQGSILSPLLFSIYLRNIGAHILTLKSYNMQMMLLFSPLVHTYPRPNFLYLLP